MEVERRQNISFWIATELLAEEGCIVETANDGVACVDMIEKADADYYKMILMDIQMPVMNGLDVAAIRNLDRKDAEFVPIIAMSANAFAEDIINSRLAGMNVHLAKPLDAEKMIVALKQCMADNRDVKLHEDL